MFRPLGLVVEIDVNRCRDRAVRFGPPVFVYRHGYQLKPTPTPPEVSPPPDETPAEMLAFWFENMC